MSKIPMHIYLEDGGAIGVKSRYKPSMKYKDMFVVYEWFDGKFRMAVFPEISPKRLLSDDFIYVGKLINPPML